MKNIRSLLLAAVLATPAFAIDWTVSMSGGPLAFLGNGSGQVSTYSNTWANITSQGFNAASHVITSATVTFSFADDPYNNPDSSSEYVDIFVNGVQRANEQEVNGTHAAFANYTYNITDAATLAALASGPVGFQVKVGSYGGDTYLKVASLTVTGQTRPPGGGSGVPDGGSSVAILGLGLLALVGAGRRFKS